MLEKRNYNYVLEDLLERFDVTSDEASRNGDELDHLLVQVAEVDDDDEHEGEQVGQECDDEEGQNRVVLRFVVSPVQTVRASCKRSRYMYLLRHVQYM